VSCHPSRGPRIGLQGIIVRARSSILSPRPASPFPHPPPDTRSSLPTHAHSLVLHCEPQTVADASAHARSRKQLADGRLEGHMGTCAGAGREWEPPSARDIKVNEVRAYQVPILYPMSFLTTP
jgi:hypothetical protein